jgi:hypothetical protein
MLASCKLVAIVLALNCLILPYLVLMVRRYDLGHKLQRLALETNSIIGIMSLVRCSNFVIEVHQHFMFMEKNRKIARKRLIRINAGTRGRPSFLKLEIISEEFLNNNNVKFY